ncbi:MAG: glycosyl hydrolase-related protein [Alphaproteobacteria bacterium]|nr:glycosyl hydrolase-related protein [Alphaproteobacteria bacterium]
MSGRWPFTAEKVASRLSLIAPFVHRRILALPHFRMLPLPGATLNPPICQDPATWQEISHETYWGHADLNFVMKSEFEIPKGWNRERIALYLPLGVMGDIFNHPEAMVYVDQQPLGSADRYHHTVPLPPNVCDGKRHVVSLHGWTGLSGWPPDPTSKAKLFMGVPAIIERDPVLLDFHRTAHTALDAANALDVESAESHALLAVLDRAVTALDTRDPISDALYDSAQNALDLLKRGIAMAGPALDVTLHGIGHAHMDVAYLWPISQIRLKNARTYSNVLRLMDENPDYRFSHSQPQLYAMTAEDYPQLFDRIAERVSEGRWEVMGGMWVEPDLNIPGPEALIRQLTLGRGYFRDTFGDVETPVLWLPDTFGFPAQIPQLMRLAGLKWFVTNKLNWNQINQVPSSTHRWEGLDGSQVLAHILTTPRDVQYLPFPTNYKSDLSAAEVLGTWNRSTAQDQLKDLPICYGYGDGGGGPTEDLLAKARTYRAMPGMPQIKPSSVRDVFQAIEKVAADLPLWKGEHYMEGHRGVYTSQGWIKRANRKAEWALHEAEAMAAMAGQVPDLQKAWQLLCLNQFHDIITGTSIGAVFEDARRDYVQIMKIAESASRQAAEAISIREPSVCNTSPVSGPRLALISGDHVSGGQQVESGTLIYFDNLPSYSVTPISAMCIPNGAAECRQDADLVVMENPALRITIDQDGQLQSVFDKAEQRQILDGEAPGNQLLAFEDRPICWDAWDIDPSYEDRCENLSGTVTREIVETGPLRVSVRITKAWRNSIIRQEIRLSAHSNRIDFVTDVDWHETHTLLKAAFPTGIDAKRAQFDTQWGRVERATTHDTSFDAARFEVPAQKWAQVSNKNHAVAVLNDCKYGYDIQGGVIRITLIKCATSPDPNADQGRHEFTYSLLPYSISNPKELDVEAYDLNAPLRSIPTCKAGTTKSAPLVTCSNDNVIIETVKPAFDQNGIVVRVFEARDRHATTVLSFNSTITSADIVTISEEPIEPLAPTNNTVEISLAPFQILTLRLTLDSKHASTR